MGASPQSPGTAASTLAEPTLTESTATKSTGPEPTEPESTEPAGLPYDPWLQNLLDPLRAGFRVVNRWVTEPIYRLGLGPLLSNPLTGSILVLRTTGRKTGLVREAPLGYAIVDGRIVVVAGYGRDCHWFRNAVAHPQVEISLPGAVLARHAEEITDPELRRRAFRDVVTALGVIGRVTLGDVESADDARIDELVAGFPLLAVTPTEVLPGPYDPDGTFWRIPLGATVGGAALAGAVTAWRHSARSSTARSSTARSSTA